MIPDNLKKKCFWDYNINVPIEEIPAPVQAQRYVDFWPYFHEAFNQKIINKNDIKYIVKVISEFESINYCEDVRAYVIKNLINRWFK